MSILAIAARASAMPILLFVILMALKWYDRAESRELFPGQYSQVEPHVQQWFKSQKVPDGAGKGALCCNLADGTLAEEDIRGESYWTRWPGQDWIPVPPETIIYNSRNPNGSPVVWWGYEDGKTRIRCFVPGGGV